ncbi:hypothetical protein KJ836_03405 [Patescibacteria group bacterium]|nr:hypothetical protein [Patescibacteria group bacterium]
MENILEPNQNQAIDQEEIVVEKEWDRIEKLLIQKNKPALNMAVIEADKLFREVLGIISFGDTVNEAVQNSSNLFSNLKGLLEVRKVYEDIVEVPGFFVDQKTAKDATAIYLRAILDMMGKDYQPKGTFHAIFNELAYFSETRPYLLRKIFLGVLIFLVGVWFLADTALGQVVVGVAVGLTHFVLNWVWWLVVILSAIFLIVLLSWLFFERRKR